MPSYEFGGYDLSRMYQVRNVDGATIYSSLIATVSGCGEAMFPHHPLQCPDPSTWVWYGDDDFACKHKSVLVTDEKLQAAINYSISTLLIDLARLL